MASSRRPLSLSPSRLGPTSRRRLRWFAPLGLAGAVAAAALLPGTATAEDSPVLPARTAAQLLADLQSADVSALSGTVVETARLGLPALPQTSGGGGDTDPLALVSGSHTLRVWYDGATRQRVALTGQLAEYDAVHNGRDAWTYSSDKNEVTHLRLPAVDGHAGPAGLPGSGSGTAGDSRSYATPQAAADAVLAAVDTTTAVTVDRTAKVAGRSAYQLVLAPRDTSALVGSVRVALDAVTKIPLRVQVWSTTDPRTPAIEVGFTDVTFSRPDASVFAFTPPAGATVKQQTVPSYDGSRSRPESAAVRPDGAQPRVLGTGWTSVVEVTGVDASALTGQSGALVNQLTTRVPEGRAVTTALVSVLLTDDGRVLAGAVPVDRLRELSR